METAEHFKFSGKPPQRSRWTSGVRVRVASCVNPACHQGRVRNTLAVAGSRVVVRTHQRCYLFRNMNIRIFVNIIRVKRSRDRNAVLCCQAQGMVRVRQRNVKRPPDVDGELGDIKADQSRLKCRGHGNGHSLGRGHAVVG